MRFLICLVTITLLLTSCKSPSPEPIVTPTQPVPTQSPTSTPSPTKTLTPSPTVTPTYDVVLLDEEKREQKEHEIRENIDKFLRSKGVYSDKALKENSFVPDDKSGETGLGLISCAQDFSSDMQGVVLGVLPGPNGEFVHVFFGTENSGGGRIVLPFRVMQTEYFEQHIPLQVLLFKGKKFSWASAKPNDPSSTMGVFEPESVIKKLESMINVPVTVSLPTFFEDDFRKRIIDLMVEKGASHDEAVDFFDDVFENHSASKAQSITKLARKVSNNCNRLNVSKYSNYDGIVITEDNQLIIDFEEILSAEDYALLQTFILREK